MQAQTMLRECRLAASVDEYSLHAAHVIGNTGILILDNKSARLFTEPDFDLHSGFAYLGREQWSDIAYYLRHTFNEVQRLIVFSPTPIVLYSSYVNDAFAFFHDDFLGFPGHAPFSYEQIKLLLLLSEWERGCNGREVIIVGGDIHNGLFTDLFFNNTRFARQLTTSPISNAPLSRKDQIITALPSIIFHRLGTHAHMSGFADDAMVRNKILSQIPLLDHKSYGSTQFRNYGLLIHDSNSTALYLVATTDNAVDEHGFAEVPFILRETISV